MNRQNMNSIKAFSCILTGFFAISNAAFTESNSWSFQGGNLVSNWSFENETTEICQTEQPGTGGTQTYCRQLFGQASHRGNYVLTVTVKNEANPVSEPYSVSQISKLIPIEPSTHYAFSVNMNVRWTERNTCIARQMRW